MKFRTSDNLISLLVGQNLYSTADAALRELLQNADDACKLMRISDPSFRPQITIRYSISKNYFEVDDNGLGMDNEIFQESFATIGASKTESCLSGYHPHPLYVVCLLGLQARAGAGALRRRSG